MVLPAKSAVDSGLRRGPRPRAPAPSCGRPRRRVVMAEPSPDTKPSVVPRLPTAAAGRDAGRGPRPPRRRGRGERHVRRRRRPCRAAPRGAGRRPARCRSSRRTSSSSKVRLVRLASEHCRLRGSCAKRLLLVGAPGGPDRQLVRHDDGLVAARGLAGVVDRGAHAGRDLVVGLAPRRPERVAQRHQFCGRLSAPSPTPKVLPSNLLPASMTRSSVTMSSSRMSDERLGGLLRALQRRRDEVRDVVALERIARPWPPSRARARRGCSRRCRP